MRKQPLGTQQQRHKQQARKSYPPRQSRPFLQQQLDRNFNNPIQFQSKQSDNIQQRNFYNHTNIKNRMFIQNKRFQYQNKLLINKNTINNNQNNSNHNNHNYNYNYNHTNNSNNFMTQNQYLNVLHNINGNINRTNLNLHVNMKDTQKEQIVKIQSQMDIQYSHNKNLNITNNNKIFNDQPNEFKYCRCQGKPDTMRNHQQNQSQQQQQQQIMTCTSCQHKYHYQCLKIRKQHQSSYTKCPSCKLQQYLNLFQRIHHQPLFTKWHKISQNNIISFSFTQQQIRNIKYLTRKYTNILNQVQFHLKFLKIKDKNYDHEKQQQKLSLPQLQKQKNNQPHSSHSQQQLSQQKIQRQQSPIKSQSKNTFNTIILPTNYILNMLNIQKNNYFQIILKQQQNSNIQPQQGQRQEYFFVAIYLVQRLKPQTLAKQLFINLNQTNSVDEKYINKFFSAQQSTNIQTNSNNNIKINTPPQQLQFIDIAITHILSPYILLPHPIPTPIRGNNCHHYQVFDYYITLLIKQQQINQNNNKQTNKQKKIQCPICGKICQKIIADRFLYQIIQDKRMMQVLRRDHLREMTKEDLKVRYYKNGSIQWINNDNNFSQKNHNQINHRNHNINNLNSSQPNSSNNFPNINPLHYTQYRSPHPNQPMNRLFQDYQNMLSSLNHHRQIKSYQIEYNQD